MSSDSQLDGYVDLLDEVRKQGDLIWVMQQRQFFEKQTKKQKRKPEDIKHDVLNSVRLKHTIEKLVDERLKYIENEKSKIETGDEKRLYDEFTNEAKAILDEMSHNFDLKYVRFLGFMLIKVLKTIYKHVYYNKSIYENISQLVNDGRPVLYMPNHRSYMDFLLVSIVCFHTDIKMPIIAAGQDFLGLARVSKWIRNSGAFFIRRSFGSDKLYWAIFYEYVQTHLVSNEFPIEFFLEGMRSRTSKALVPKQGMLATCLELLFKRQVDDVHIVPISITYERLLEEMLYANELLGIPKPKESVSGLMKARKILNDCYGSIIINFSKPLSARQLLSSYYNIDRCITHALTPRFIFDLDRAQYKSVELCSYDILFEIVNRQIVQPMSLIASCLMIAQSNSNNDHEIELKSAIVCIQTLKTILTNLGFKLYWPIVSNSEQDIIKYLLITNLQTHSNLVYLKYLNKLTNKYEFIDASTSTIQGHDSFSIGLRKSLKNDHFENAANYLALSIYRNQIINYFVQLAFTSICLVAYEPIDRQSLLDLYKFLVQIFNKEFIIHPAKSIKEFDMALNYLKLINSIENSASNSNTYKIGKYNFIQMQFIIRILFNFLSNYSQIYAIIIKLNIDKYFDDKQFAKQIQDYQFQAIGSKSKQQDDFKYDYECLSLNLISNCISSLKSNSIISVRKRVGLDRDDDDDDDSSRHIVDLVKLNEFYNKLNMIIENVCVKMNKYERQFESLYDDVYPYKYDKRLIKLFDNNNNDCLFTIDQFYKTNTLVASKL